MENWVLVFKNPISRKRNGEVIILCHLSDLHLLLAQLMLRLKLQYFGHLMRRVDSLEKTLMLGGIEGRRRRG